MLPSRRPTTLRCSRRSGIVLGCALALAPIAGHAQADGGSLSLAEQLVQQGFTLRAEGRLEEAAALLARAVELEPSGRNHAQWGLCLQALGEWRRAEEALSRALLLSADPWVQSHRIELEGARARVEVELATLVVESNALAAVYVDGAREGVGLERSLRLRAGQHVVEVRAEGYVPLQRVVQLRGGGTARERFDLVRALDPIAPRTMDERGLRGTAPSLAVSTEARVEPRGVLGVTALVTGGVLLGGSAMGFAFREDAAVRYNAMGCPPPSSSPTGACGSIAAAELTWGTLRWVLLGGGVTFAGLGVGLLLWPSPSSAGGRAVVSVRCGPLGCGGRF
jgi:hypothetical protein